MYKVRKIAARSMFMGLIVLLNAGCAHSLAIISNDHEVHEARIEGSLENYQLQVGDKISLVCVVKEGVGTNEPYSLNIGDIISLRVQDRQDLSYDYKVNPDGSVQFMGLGVVKVQGKSLEKLRAELERGYHKAGVLDGLSLGIKKYNIAVESFISKLNPGGLGNEPYSTTISVDGTANFPLIGFIKLDGLTLQQANLDIENKYIELFKNIDVTLRIEPSEGHSITILGEVEKPGAFSVSGSVSVLAVLGGAEGYTDEAKLDSIMVVQKRGKKVYVKKYDLDSDLFAMADHKLIAGDFVFVPKSRVANVNTFVDQYLRRNIPFGTSISYHTN